MWCFLTQILCYCLTGELTGQMLAYITLLPIAILVGFVTLIVFKRELHTVSTVHVYLVFKRREYKTVGLSDVYAPPTLLCRFLSLWGSS